MLTKQLFQTYRPIFEAYQTSSNQDDPNFETTYHQEMNALAAQDQNFALLLHHIRRVSLVRRHNRKFVFAALGDVVDNCSRQFDSVDLSWIWFFYEYEDQFQEAFRVDSTHAEPACHWLTHFRRQIETDTQVAMQVLLRKLECHPLGELGLCPPMTFSEDELTFLRNESQTNHTFQAILDDTMPMIREIIAYVLTTGKTNP